MTGFARILSNLALPETPGYAIRCFGHYPPEHPSPGAPERRGLAAILSRIPAAEKPDALILSSPEYLPIPTDLAAFPGPKILLITDWNVCLRFLPDLCPLFDFCFTDWEGYRLLRRSGVANVHHQPLFGHDPDRFADQGKQRNLDVSFCGNLNGSLHGDRNRTLARLGRWGSGRSLHLGQTFGDAYVDVLNRSRLVFNHSIRGEANMRLFEAMACGAVPLVEAGNRETAILFQEGRHYFRYEPDRLEERLDALLAEPTRIEAAAAEARLAVAGHTKAAQIRALLDFAGRESPGLIHAAATAASPAIPLAIPLPSTADSHKALVKLRVLGMDYTMADAVSELQSLSDDWPGLAAETLPGALLTLLETYSGPPLPAAEAVLERMLGDGSQPEPFRRFLRLRLDLVHRDWLAVLEGSQSCLDALGSAQVTGAKGSGGIGGGGGTPAPMDRLRLFYGRFHPPIGLGKGFNTDINRAFRQDLASAGASSTGAPNAPAGPLRGYADLLRAHCLDARARALLALGRPAEAGDCAEAIPPGRYVSLENHALLAEARFLLGDGNGLRATLRDWFRERPLDTGAWDKIAGFLERIGDQAGLIAFLEDILVLSRHLLPPEQAEAIRALLARKRAEAGG